jgi:geranylgeranyl pyrophosphate synthase
MAQKKEYFERMKKISSKVDNVLGGLFSDPNYTEFTGIDRLYQARRGRPKFRAFLTQESYKLCGGQGETPELCAVSELSNYSPYLDNWVLDDKQGIWKGKNVQADVCGITINSAVQRELCDIVLSKANLSPEQELLVRREANKMGIECQRGQRRDLEMNIGTLNQYKKDEEFIEAYRKRCELSTGYWYGFSCALGAVGAGADTKARDSLFRFGFSLGTGLHASNDLGDFALFDTRQTLKYYQDQMADLMNKRLTLPVYYTLKYGTDDQREALLLVSERGREASEGEKEAASRAMVESGAYDFCRSFVNEYVTQCKSILHRTFPKSDSRDALSSASRVVKTNKYLVNLRKLKGTKNE